MNVQKKFQYQDYGDSWSNLPKLENRPEVLQAQPEEPWAAVWGGTGEIGATGDLNTALRGFVREKKHL